MPPIDAKGLPALARRLFSEGPVRTLTTPRRVRIIHEGTLVVDTTKALYVWEHPYYPYFYLPADAFDQKVVSFEVVEAVSGENSGAAKVMKMEVKGKPDSATDRVLSISNGGKAELLSGMIRVDFSAVGKTVIELDLQTLKPGSQHAIDSWFEEDQPIFVHPKDPFKRLDLLPSTRNIRVTVPDPQTGADVVLADTPFAIHLFETSLPVRYYMPITHIDAALLRHSARNTKTLCPYKGEAEYYDIVLPDGTVLPDLVWYYNRPTPECASATGMCCFYTEKVDIWIDGTKQERPKSVFA